MLAFERFLDEAGELRGRAIELDDRVVAIGELGFDSFAITELLMIVEDMCDAVPYPADGPEVLGWSLRDLYDAAASAAVVRPLDDRL
jgi:hypothetical protein